MPTYNYDSLLSIHLVAGSAAPASPGVPGWIWVTGIAVAGVVVAGVIARGRRDRSELRGATRGHREDHHV